MPRSDVKAKHLTPEVRERFWCKVDVREPDECWNWVGCKNADGYGHIKVLGHTLGAHRVSFALKTGRWPEPCCRHTCDNSSCVNPGHLTEGTHRQNMGDMHARGRAFDPSGEKNPRTLLSEEQVIGIRRHLFGAYKRGLQKQLAVEHGVSSKLISEICRGNLWPNLLLHGPKPKVSGPIGEFGACKLTYEEARQIRRRYAESGISQTRLGAEFGVTQTTIGRLVRGECWGQLGETAAHG